MSLAALLDLGERELVALVGGGGKSTLLFALGDELADAGSRVLLTTTTKMGRHQADSAATVCWSADVACAVTALDQRSPVMLVTEGDDHKVTGPDPGLIDSLFFEANVDYILVEADGSRGMPLKAPAAHEPVIPVTATAVVILMGVDAVGRPLAEVVHRVDEARRFTGLSGDHKLTPVDCAAILLHPDGALRRVPEDAKAIIGLTKADRFDPSVIRDLRTAIARQRPGIAVVAIPAA